MYCLKKYDYISYLDRSLPQDERIGYELHFSMCAACKSAIEQLQKSIDLVESEKEIRANPFLYTRILEKLSVNDYIPLRIRVLKPVIIAGIAIFSLILGVALGNYLTNLNAVSADSNSIVWNEIEHENIEMAFLQE